MKAHTFRDWCKDREGMSWRLWHKELWYYLKCRFWRKYNVIKIRSLPPTWRDADQRLLHASFTILCDVVEQEDWFNHGCYEPDPTSGWDERDRWQEVALLYDWWVNVRPNRIEPHEWAQEERERLGIERLAYHNLNKPMSDTEREIIFLTQEIEEAQELEDDNMMKRLIDIRRCLWT